MDKTLVPNMSIVQRFLIEKTTSEMVIHNLECVLENKVALYSVKSLHIRLAC